MPERNRTISLGAMRYAGRYDAMSGTWGADRAQVLAWASHPMVGAISRAEILPPAGTHWRVHFRRMTEKIQERFGLKPDGDFGPETAAVMERYGYTITS